MSRLLCRVPFALVLGLMILVYAAICLWVAIVNGSVNDEYAAHIISGYLYWRTGSFAGGVANPPLGQLWVALPYAIFRDYLSPFTDLPPIGARLQNILLCVLLLATLGQWLRRTIDDYAALGAVAVLSTTPDFCAHATLATLDLPISFTMVLALVCSALWFQRPHGRLLLATSFATGAALATKATGFLLFVLILCGWLVAVARSRSVRRYSWRLARSVARRPWVSLSQAGVVGICVWLVVAVAYRCAGCWSSKTGLFSGSLLLDLFFRPWPTSFLEAALAKFGYVRHGNLAYLLGHFSREGWWWYYPVAVVLKAPFPLVLLWLLGLVWTVGRRQQPFGVVFSAGAALAFLLFAILLSRTQIGTRHLLPMYPLLAVACAPLFATSSKKAIRAAGIMLLLCNAVSFATILPYPLTSENICAAGRGYRIFADSNYDWGQANAAIVRLAEDPSSSVARPQPFVPQAGRFIVRVNELNGFPKWPQGRFPWLEPYEPCGRVAGAGLLYSVGWDDLSATMSQPRSPWRCAAAAIRLEEGGQPAAAEAEIRAGLQRGCSAEYVWRIWASYLENKGETTRALAALRRASLLVPNDRELTNDYERLALLVQAERVFATSPERAWFFRANAALLERDFASARRYAEQAQRAGAPTEAIAPLLYHVSCLQGDWATASQLARIYPHADSLKNALPKHTVELVTRRSLTPREGYDLALWAYRQQAWITTAHLLTEALQIDPSFGPALNLLGELVVGYKDWSLSLTPEERQALERIKVVGRARAKRS